MDDADGGNDENENAPDRAGDAPTPGTGAETEIDAGPKSDDRRRSFGGGAWEQVVEDMEATALALRESGYEIVELHPGDVTVLEERFDVVVPNGEFDRLEAVVTDGMDEAQVFRAERGGTVYALAVLTDPEAAAGVCCPLYYGADADLGTDGVTLHLRALSEDAPVVVAVEDASLFSPEPGDEAGETGP